MSKDQISIYIYKNADFCSIFNPEHFAYTKDKLTCIEKSKDQYT